MPVDARAKLTQAFFDETQAVEAGWLERVKARSIEHRRPYLDKIAWQGFDRKVNRPS